MGLFNFLQRHDENSKNTETELPVKYFAVVHTDQGRMRVVIEDTQEDRTRFLLGFCDEPTDIEAIGTCNKNGVIGMTNPNKFERKWLDGQIRNQLCGFMEQLFGGK